MWPVPLRLRPTGLGLDLTHRGQDSGFRPTLTPIHPPTRRPGPALEGMLPGGHAPRRACSLRARSLRARSLEDKLLEGTSPMGCFPVPFTCPFFHLTGLWQLFKASLKRQ